MRLPAQTDCAARCAASLSAHEHTGVSIPSDVVLSTTPCSNRQGEQRPTLRELIVPFGSTGHVLRFDIRTPEWLRVIGARHRAKKTSTDGRA